MSKSMKKKALVSSILTIALCFSVIAGSTLALFTSKSEVNIAVTSGKVNLEAYIDETSLETSSLGVAQDAGKFAVGGTASFNDKTADLVLDKIVPGDKATFKINVKNNSTVDVMYRLSWTVDNEKLDTLKTSAVALATDTNGEGTVLSANATEWIEWVAPANGAEERTIEASIELPMEVSDEKYQDQTANVTFTVEAVQANGTDYYGKALVTTAENFVEALKQGGEVVVLNDIEVPADALVDDDTIASIPVGLYISKDTVIDLNGNDIVFEDNGEGTVAAIFAHDADLTIKGEGKISQLGSDDYLLWAKGDSNVTIESGDFYAAGDDSSLLYASGNVTYDSSAPYATIVVTGGNFVSDSVDPQDYFNVMNHGVGRISLQGGTYNFDPDFNNYSDISAIDDKAYVTIPKYYESKNNNDGTYTIVFNMSAALADPEVKDITLTSDVQFSQKIKNDANINLNGNTFEAMGTLELSNNADLAMTGGKYEVNGTYGHVDVRPSTAEGSVVTFEDVDFSFNKLNPTYGPSTNRLGTVVEVCATATDAKTVIVFKNCTFDNAQVLFEGMSGKTGEFEATFENCTFNALTSSAPIYVQNYVKGTLNVKNCTFNLETTSSTASAISISSSSSTIVTLNAENNTINAVAATPYTYDAAAGETEVNNVKVNGTPKDIKFASYYGNTTANITGTIATGIAVK